MDLTSPEYGHDLRDRLVLESKEHMKEVRGRGHEQAAAAEVHRRLDQVDAAEVCGGRDLYVMLSTADIGRTVTSVHSTPGQVDIRTEPTGLGGTHTTGTVSGGQTNVTNTQKPAMEGYIRCLDAP